MKSVSTATVLLAAWIASPMQAAERDQLALRSLAATCANCHGTDGSAVAGSALPALAGQPLEALAAALRAFKAGSRPATVMQQLTKGYSDAQIDQLAAYFASRKPS